MNNTSQETTNGKKQRVSSKEDTTEKKVKKANGTTKPDKAKAEATDKGDKPAKKADKGGDKAKPKKAADKADTGKAKRKEPAETDRWGLRVGSLRSQAVGMYSGSREIKKGKMKGSFINGSTLNEVKEAISSSQLNVLKDMEERGHKLVRTKEPGKGNKEVTRYFLIHKDDVKKNKKK